MQFILEKTRIKGYRNAENELSKTRGK